MTARANGRPICRVLHGALVHVPIGRLSGEPHRPGQHRRGKRNQYGSGAALVSEKLS
jgi:hypothetical protein